MIDIHVHIRWLGFSIDDVLQYMRTDRIDKCVLLSLLPSRDNRGVTSVSALNWQVYSEFLRYPDRLIPFFMIDPRDNDIKIQMERYAEMGFKGFGEHKTEDVPFDSPGCQEIYEMCKKFDLPVLFHIGRGGFPESDMGAVEEMIKKYDEVVFIAHSMGWWKQISKEWCMSQHSPTGKVVPGGNVDRMLSQYSNLYADISTSEGLRALARDPDFTEGFLERHQKKLVFGTDFPAELGSPQRYKEQVNFRKKLMQSEEYPVELPDNYMRLLDLVNRDGELRDDFTHNNIARILHLPTM